MAQIDRKSLIEENRSSINERVLIQLSDEKFNAFQWANVFQKIRSDNFYSQIGEDIILSIIFADRINQGGFYIDVGANDPNNNSVTKFFYERGWTGVNIEPIKELYENFVIHRPRDINLNVAVDKTIGEISFHEVMDWQSISTSNSQEVGKIHERGYKTREYKIPTQTLDHIIKANVKNEINFLKIDVEGFERNVLESIDLTISRPIVICIEATYPCTDVPCHNLWEDILEKTKYKFAYFDGFNRYYVREENREIVQRFEFVKSIMSMLQKLIVIK